MLEENLDGVDSGSLTPGLARQVCIQRHPSYGFGFIAGSERPVVVRSVFTDGPSEGKLLPGDQIFAINEEPVSNVSRERVIDLVRSCKESITLTVLQPHQSPKSAFISAAKKAHLRTNPPKVRFSEEVSISDPESTMLKDDSLLLIPNVLKVFLENGQIKSFTFDSRTTVRDVISSLQDRLSLRYIEHFALVLESGRLYQNHRLHLLQESQPLYHVVQKTYFQGMKCLFRICFFPKDPADLLRRDPAAFEYLYIQSRNDVIKERFSTDWKSDVTLKLAALHIYITVSAARPNQKISLKHVEKEWGLEPFLPLTLLPIIKEKNICKSLSQLLKTYQHPPPSGNKVPPLQGKLQYIRALNELPPFGGVLFHTVGLDEKHSATTLLVGPRHGISHVIDLKNNLTTVLVEFRRVAKIQLFREYQGVARVEVTILEAKPLVLLMEWPDATNFACLISGYYKLFVDPKKAIYCRTPGQSHMIKADYGVGHEISRHSSAASGATRRDEMVFRQGKHSEHQALGLCHLHLKEQQWQFQDLQQQVEGQMDINENLIGQQEVRPRTKSDPTLKSSESIMESDSLTLDAEGFRGRARTLDPVKQAASYFCDSCKAKLHASAEKNCSSQMLDVKHYSKTCAFCNGNAVDLMSLPLPGSEGDKEEEVGEDKKGGGALQPPPPAIAAPPPGFRDNSSDEDDPKRARKTHSPGVARRPHEAMPMTLIDGTVTRTVRDHARELDDALVSTLQALEALAASEDYPHHHQQHPQATGLIVLAAITPESSLDSGHETNTSELTDVSEMVLAMKQHQTPAYLLAHHINKDRLFGRSDFPLAIPGCSTQAIAGGAFSMGQLRGRCPPKTLILTKSASLRLSPGQEVAALSPVAQASNQNAQNSENSKLEPTVGVPTGLVSQASMELKAANQNESSHGSNDHKMSFPAESRPSSKPSPDINQKKSASPSPETTNKALPILLPADKVSSAKVCLTNMCQGAETACVRTKRSSSSKGLLPAENLFCTCPLRPQPAPLLQLKESQAQKAVVFHSSSPTDDERIRAKAKSQQLPSNKEGVVQGPEPSLVKSTTPTPPRNLSLTTVRAEHKEKTEVKTEIPQSKVSIEQQKSLKPLPSPVESAQAIGYAGTMTAEECRIQGNSKPKQQRSAPFSNLRNLLSATFPARQRRETDERRAHLQKVREYELEFLEELLKPKTAQVEFMPQGSSPVPAGTPCLCRPRTSPVQKVPGVSREQRRSCDCKRLCRGLPLPDTPVVSALEQRGRERIVSRTSPVVPKTLQLQEGLRRPHSLEIKTTRIRSSSLESREPQGASLSCLPACTSHSECMGDPHYKKLLRSNSLSGPESDQMPLYAEVKPIKSRSLEKELEQIKTTRMRLSTPTEPTYAQLGDRKKKGAFSILGEEPLRETPVEADKAVMGLPIKKDDGGKQCYAFCFCYRKCKEAEEGSEKDELSYSVPVHVLPGMQLDANALSVVNKTLQVLDAEDCTGEEEPEEEPQGQEIDLRACSSLEASLARVQALQCKTFSLPDGFLSAQLDANELLAILRQCASSPLVEDGPWLQAPQLTEYKQELAVRFREFRASCRHVACVEKSPTRMLSAVAASFQVLCGLMQTYIRLVHGVRSEAQRLQLLRKVEEVAHNYTLLLRAAEESMGRSSSLPSKTSSTSPMPIHANVGSLTRSIKTQIIK
ncbi:FERM and PDZ domain-containing protein 3-like [Megalops cyprinoides]|uniref:FERM and PDZ domain-containing protein 3-like n=1 Tax=Megalops cyprinoides TaxID=118141 RepID=UPI00186417DA|nr:FERM and PDZ domain-containing protein 3-like [Megalops cyprinoides]